MSKWTCLLAVLVVTSLVAGAGWAASAPPTTRVAAEPSLAKQDDGWRRTADGWERLDQFLPASTTADRDYPLRRIHPALLAALQILLAAGALLFANQRPAAEAKP